MRIHVVLRSYGGENSKPRPSYYSKDLCLLSLWRAWLACSARGEMMFLNDGPLPQARLAIMAAMGELLPQLPRVGWLRSLRTALGLVDSRPWDDDDLVLFLEDDYLLLPETFVEIADVAGRNPEISYITPYDYPLHYPSAKGAGGGRELLFLSGSRHWRTVESATHTFGGRVGVVRVDSWVHHLALREPSDGLTLRTSGRTHAYSDRAAFLALQGLPPYRRLHRLVFQLGPSSGLPEDRQPLRHRLKRAVTGWSYRARLLVCPMPSLAAHMETEFLPPVVDWAAAAADLMKWAGTKGLDAMTGEPLAAG